jgi:L-threonylcarbamoyladenylate synthase
MADSRVLPADEPDNIKQAVRLLRAGGVVAFPTDTVYGLGAHGFIASAIEELYVLKRREREKAIALLIAGLDDLRAVAAEVPAVAWRLAEQFWPGPLTLVLPKASAVLDVLTASGQSVAVRMPAHEMALRLIRSLDAPLAATSANLSGEPEAVTARQVEAVFGDQLRVILDGGRCPGGVASTVVDVTVSPVLIRRRGPVADEVAALLSETQ